MQKESNKSIKIIVSLNFIDDNEKKNNIGIGINVTDLLRKDYSIKLIINKDIKAKLNILTNIKKFMHNFVPT